MLSNGNKREDFLHRLVGEAFILNPLNNPCINHKDGNKLNNHVDNLEWVTYSQNNKHAYSIGLKQGAGKKKVLQLSKEGVILNTFDSVSEAASKTNILRTSIVRHLAKKRPFAGGYLFEYESKILIVNP